MRVSILFQKYPFNFQNNLKNTLQLLKYLKNYFKFSKISWVPRLKNTHELSKRILKKFGDILWGIDK